jgi:hypothetical protein
MRRDEMSRTEEDRRLSRPVALPSLPHPALIALVRLLARSAAREAVPGVRSDERASTDVED